MARGNSVKSRGTPLNTLGLFDLPKLFEACSAGITARATNLIGIYESDKGRKGE